MSGQTRPSSIVGLLMVLCVTVKAATFSNDNLIVEKPNQINVGDQVSFYCELPDAGQAITGCQVVIPDGSIWTVEGGQVTDDSGSQISGYSAIDNGYPSKVCGIDISTSGQSDLGDWKFVLTRTGGVTTVLNAIVNLRTSRYAPDANDLPNNVSPINYDIDLIVSLDPDFTVDGYFAATASVLFGAASTASISLHFRYMSFVESSLAVTNNGGANLNLIDFTIDFDRETFTVQFDTPATGETFDAIFSGNFNYLLNTQNGIGFYRDSYIDVNTGAEVWMAVTQFETNDARMAFPCMDEPALKATYNIRLGHSDTLVSQSNGMLIASGDPVSGYPGYIWDEFDTTPIMSSYLIAFAVSDFASLESAPLSNGVIHTAWARYDAIQDGLAEYVKTVGPLIIQGYEDVFNVLYPIPKMDQISPFHKGGAMENWGLITYSEVGLLIDVPISSAKNEKDLVSVQAHEIAHQWFGDIVTCDWWSYIWLNEGFATYVSYVGSEIVAPHFDNYNLFVYGDLFSALHADDNAGSHEISEDVPDAESAHFGSITYDKGGSLIRMVEHFITKATWTKGLTNYLNAKSYSSAIPDDLFYYWDEAAKEDGTLANDKFIKTIMDTWTLQKNYPVLTVERDYVGGTASLTQERFLVEPDTTGDSHDYKWWIPLTYTTVGDDLSDFSDTYNYNQWFPADQETLIVTTGGQDSPLIFNVQFTSFYRTNYDSENWNRIAIALDSDPFAIHEANRAQLLTDSYELGLAGILPDFTTAISMANYLPAENRYPAIAIAASNLRDSISKAPDYYSALYDSFVAQYTSLGMDEYVGETWNFNMVQRDVIDSVCRYDYQPCVDDANSVFATWMASPDPDDLANNPVNRHARSMIYCTVVRNGGDAEYNFIEDRYNNNRNPQERSNLNSAKGCKPDVDSLTATLKSFIAYPSGFDNEEFASFLSMNTKLVESVENIYFGNDDFSSGTFFEKERLFVITEALSRSVEASNMKMLQDLNGLFNEINGFDSPIIQKALNAIQRNISSKPVDV